MVFLGSEEFTKVQLSGSFDKHARGQSNDCDTSHDVHQPWRHKMLFKELVRSFRKPRNAKQTMIFRASGSSKLNYLFIVSIAFSVDQSTDSQFCHLV